jgi:hypothetical protein
MKKFTISFDFKGRPCQAVISAQQKSGGREFAVTSLEADLEQLLDGNRIIRETGGTLEADILAEKKDQTELKLIIASRLSDYLKIACFVGNECLTPHAHAENCRELHPLLRHNPYDDKSNF